MRWCFSALKTGVGSHDQRKGMGLLEYQAMPSLCDMLMTVFCVHSVIDQPQTGASGVRSVKAGGMDRPSRTESHPARSFSSSQTGDLPCWASHLAFSLIAHYSMRKISHLACYQCLLPTYQPRGDIVKTGPDKTRTQKTAPKC